MSMIWKYKIPFKYAGEFSITMPNGALVLKVMYQPNEKEFFIWCLVNPFLADVKRHFRLVETGQSIDAEITWKYIGILMIDNGQYVLNLFEII